MENKEIEVEIKNAKEKLDIKGINNIISLVKRLLRIGLYMAVILTIYGLIILCKEAGVFKFLLTLVRIITPLFIGIVIAWLFNPLVKWLERKKIKRVFAVLIVYVVFLGIIGLILATMLPTLYNQLHDFSLIIPSVVDSVQKKINGVFSSLGNLSYINVDSIKTTMFAKIEALGTDISSNLPATIINTLTSFLSGVGTILVGLIIGFFFLISFDSSDSLITFLPKKIQTNTKELLGNINGALKSFVVGSILDCTFIFIISSIGLYFAGLKAPLLFGLFCGITNIIPYAGPYIGAIPAVIVGFAQGVPVGIATVIVLCVIQFLEGNFLQPVILSKTTKLHPVTIIIGLLIFGHFWGIFGMIIATPLIAALKVIVLYFNEKYGILSFK
ncbi:MAG: AI-2E family transporter [Bacilli bacterium]|nr:AI-2E family transporter [Bacilli bacterium]